MPIAKGLCQSRLLILREIIYPDDVLAVDIGNDLSDLSSRLFERLMAVEPVLDRELERLE
jgi:hypothetical protein